MGRSRRKGAHRSNVPYSYDRIRKQTVRSRRKNCHSSGWCGRWESNPHSSRNWILSPARLPVSPRPHTSPSNQILHTVRVEHAPNSATGHAKRALAERRAGRNDPPARFQANTSPRFSPFGSGPNRFGPRVPGITENTRITMNPIIDTELKIKAKLVDWVFSKMVPRIDGP